MDGGQGYDEASGGEPHISSEDQIEYGLNVLDKYDLDKEDERNDRLSYDNREGGWWIIYYGDGCEKESKGVVNIIGKV